MAIDNDDLGFVADDDLGFVEEPAKPQGFIEKAASQAVAVLPESVKAPEQSTNILEDALIGAQDFSIGAAQGASMGALDELSALASAGVSTLADKFIESDEDKVLKKLGIKDTSKAKSFLERYREDQQRAQNYLTESEERSPVLNIAGQVSGGIITGGVLDKLGLFGKADKLSKIKDIADKEGKLKAGIELLKRGGKGAAKMAPVIAAESALSSKTGGLLTEEERANLGLDVLGGTTFGLLTGGALGTAADSFSLANDAATEAATKKIAESPYFRQMAKNFQLNKQGIDVADEASQLAGAKSTFKLEEEPAKNILGELETARKKIGKELGKTVDDATKAGQVIDVTKEGTDLGKTLRYLEDNYPFLDKNIRARTSFGTIIDKFQKTGYNITPREAKDLVADIDVFTGKFRSSGNMTGEETAIAESLEDISRQLKDRLKSEVTGFAEQNKRFARFNELVPEQLIAGVDPSSLSSKQYKDMTDPELKEYQKLMNLIQGTTKEGTSSDKTRRAFSQFKEGLDKFHTEELAAGRQSVIDPQGIQTQIKEASDIAAIRQGITQQDPSAGIVSKVVGTLTGSQSGKAAGLRAAGYAGKTANWLAQRKSKSPTVNLMKEFQDAPDEILMGAAEQLRRVPKLQNIANSLENAVKTGNVQRRNQALFVIMQNPDARAVFSADNQEDQN